LAISFLRHFQDLFLVASSISSSSLIFSTQLFHDLAGTKFRYK